MSADRLPSERIGESYWGVSFCRRCGKGETYFEWPCNCTDGDYARNGPKDDQDD